jgi:DNA replication licensing factor MCM5
MSGFDLDRVFSVAVHEQAVTNSDAPSETAKQLNEFILQFRVGEEFVYRLVSH